GVIRAAVELYTRIAVALNGALNNQKKVNPDGLRAGIAAPCATSSRCHQEESEPRHNKQAGNIVKFLRPDFDKEEIKAAVGDIDENSLIRRKLTTIPAQPRREVINGERD